MDFPGYAPRHAYPCFAYVLGWRQTLNDFVVVQTLWIARSLSVSKMYIEAVGHVPSVQHRRNRLCVYSGYPSPLPMSIVALLTIYDAQVRNGF